MCYEPGRRSAAKLLSKDEARRIAANIAKLPDVMQPTRTDTDEDERTTALGLFNTADAYRLSAMALQGVASASWPCRQPGAAALLSRARTVSESATPETQRQDTAEIQPQHRTADLASLPRL
jgi:hypothetical protein